MFSIQMRRKVMNKSLKYCGKKKKRRTENKARQRVCGREKRREVKGIKWSIILT